VSSWEIAADIPYLTHKSGGRHYDAIADNNVIL
jgi:hypothetical protein